MARTMKLKHEEGAILAFRGANRFLSNFHESPITLPALKDEFGMFGEVKHAPTVEHAYQAFKAMYMEDFCSILSARTPGDAKRMGRTVEMRLCWEACKEVVMLRLLRAKFGQNKGLRRKLLETGDRMLIEGNGWGDRYWGVCNGRGKNRLGVLIMQVRAEINEQRIPDGDV